MLSSRDCLRVSWPTATALCVLSLPALATTSFVSVAPPCATLTAAPRADLVAYDGQRLSGDLHVASLRVPAGATLWLDAGTRVVASATIEIEGTLRSATVGTALAADIVLVAAERIEVRANGVVLGADGRVGVAGSAQAEAGSDVLLVAPESWVDGIVRGGDGGALGLAARGGAGGDVLVFGNAWAHRKSSGSNASMRAESGIFGGNGGYGGGDGGHALALGADPQRAAHASGLALDLAPWWRLLDEQVRSAAPARAQHPAARGWWSGNDDDQAGCPGGADGADGLGATGGDGGGGATGATAPKGSNQTGGDGGRGGDGGHAVGSAGGAGGPGANCCPNPGGTGGRGGEGGRAQGGNGGKGGDGGDGDVGRVGGCGGDGGNAGNGTGGQPGVGGTGGASLGDGGPGGFPGWGFEGVPGDPGKNGQLPNSSCDPQSGAAGVGTDKWGVDGPRGPGC